MPDVTRSIVRYGTHAACDVCTVRHSFSYGTHDAHDALHGETQILLTAHMPYLTRGMVRQSFSYDSHAACDVGHGETQTVFLLTAHMPHVMTSMVG